VGASTAARGARSPHPHTPVRAQSLRAAGFLVVVVDNRGSFRRGAAWERALSRRMGGVEVDDQTAAVRWLVAAGLTDPARVGAVGWSYGGYMSLLLLCKQPTVFTAAVAGAPVTDWAGYDTAYTERYMGRPKPFPPPPPPLLLPSSSPSSCMEEGEDEDVNPAAYAASSVLAHVGGLMPGRNRLLLVHGLIDENVHVRHTWRLLGALTAAGAPADACDALLLPCERHCVRDPAAKALMERRIGQFFRRTLLLQKGED
jgi:dipeptidyl-peptidase 4